MTRDDLAGIGYAIAALVCLSLAASGLLRWDAWTTNPAGEGLGYVRVAVPVLIVLGVAALVAMGRALDANDRKGT